MQEGTRLGGARIFLHVEVYIKAVQVLEEWEQ